MQVLLARRLLSPHWGVIGGDALLSQSRAARLPVIVFNNHTLEQVLSLMNSVYIEKDINLPSIMLLFGPVAQVQGHAIRQLHNSLAPLAT